MQQKLPIGALVKGRYQIRRELGEGGMGVVYEAFDETLARRVALKVLHADFAGDEVIAKRFINEARALATIRSEHIVGIYDTDRTGRIGNHKDAPFMAMEFLEGHDLAQLMSRRRRIPYVEAIGYILEALLAIAEAHARGIVHRDLKPANLFLSEEPDGARRIKVLDFGISKVSGLGGSQGVTTDTAVLGTPAYMSPEQLRQSSTVDVRADIWAIGVILYELITGRLPFERQTTGALFAAILTDPPRAMESLILVPAPLESIIMRCVQKKEEDRWSTVAALANALGPYGPDTSADSARRIERLASNIQRISALPPNPELEQPANKHAPYRGRDPNDYYDAPETEHSAVATMPRIPGERKGARKRLGLGVLVIAGIAGALGAGIALRATAKTSARPPTAPTPPVLTVVQATPTSTSDAPPIPATANAPAPPKKPTVRVAVSAPSDVKIVFEGKPLPLDAKNGCELPGEPDTYPRVYMVRKGESRDRPIHIRSDGTPEPSLLEWDPKAPFAGAPAPVTKPASAASSPAPKTGPAAAAAKTFSKD